MVIDAEVPDVIDERFRHNMRRIRDNQGMTQGDLSRKLVGMGWKVFHQTTITRIEAGTRPVKLSEALAIAKALRIDLDLLLSGEPDVGVISSVEHVMARMENALVEYEAVRARTLEAFEDLEITLGGAEQVDSSPWPEPVLRQRFENVKMRAHQLIKRAQPVILGLTGSEADRNGEHSEEA